MLNKILNIAIPILLVLAIYTIVVLSLCFRKKPIETNYDETKIESCLQKMQHSSISTEKTYAELKKQCENLVRCHLYIYKEVDFEFAGRTYPLFRLIKMQKGLSKVKYITTITHELIHLKYCIAQENWVQFMTFKLLYESQDENLHKAGCYVGRGILLDLYSSEYDCKGEIIKYLEGIC